MNFFNEMLNHYKTNIIPIPKLTGKRRFYTETNNKIENNPFKNSDNSSNLNNEIDTTDTFGGVKEMFQTKLMSSPYNNLNGIQEMLKTQMYSYPYDNMTGIQEMLATKKSTPSNKLSEVQEMFSTKKSTPYDNLIGIQDLFTKKESTPYGKLTGIQDLFTNKESTPYGKLTGIQDLFTNKESTPYGKLTGIQDLFTKKESTPYGKLSGVKTNFTTKPREYIKLNPALPMGENDSESEDEINKIVNKNQFDLENSLQLINQSTKNIYTIAEYYKNKFYALVDSIDQLLEIVEDNLNDEDENAENLKEIIENIKNNVVDNYEKIGEGGFAQVYKIKGDNKKTLAAKKNLHTNSTERQILEKICCHENILSVKICKDDENCDIIITDYFERGSITKLTNDLFKKQGSVSESLYIFVIYQVLQGLKYLESQNIMHGDLKMDNVYMSSDLTIVIGDFGVATEFEYNTPVLFKGTTPFFNHHIFMENYNNGILNFVEFLVPYHDLYTFLASVIFDIDKIDKPLRERNPNEVEENLIKNGMSNLFSKFLIEHTFGGKFNDYDNILSANVLKCGEKMMKEKKKITNQMMFSSYLKDLKNNKNEPYDNLLNQININKIC